MGWEGEGCEGEGEGGVCMYIVCVHVKCRYFVKMTVEVTCTRTYGEVLSCVRIWYCAVQYVH